MNNSKNEILRIVGLIIFNLGMGQVGASDFSIWATFWIAFFGNALIVFITKGAKK